MLGLPQRQDAAPAAVQPSVSSRRQSSDSDVSLVLGDGLGYEIEADVDPFVDQLKSLCITYPMRAKWVFVPRHTIGRTLGERFALEGTNWVNLRFVTPLDIALRMGAPFLVERGVHPSEEGLGPALMMRLLLDLPLEGGYFRPLADHPTMAQALWTTDRKSVV